VSHAVCPLLGAARADVYEEWLLSLALIAALVCLYSLLAPRLSRLVGVVCRATTKQSAAAKGLPPISYAGVPTVQAREIISYLVLQALAERTGTAGAKRGRYSYDPGQGRQSAQRKVGDVAL
jgi:hypothetical protein